MARKSKRHKTPVNGLAASETKNPNQAEMTAGLRVAVLANVSGEEPFTKWRRSLRDTAARARIVARLSRIQETGNLGDRRERIAGAISELKIDYGPGYRVYYVQQGDLLVILLGGGTKDGQEGDIQAAVQLWEEGGNDFERLSRNYSG